VPAVVADEYPEVLGPPLPPPIEPSVEEQPIIEPAAVAVVTASISTEEPVVEPTPTAVVNQPEEVKPHPSAAAASEFARLYFKMTPS
jgi:hypothetical protein